jgi:hypothetical protein
MMKKDAADHMREGEGAFRQRFDQDIGKAKGNGHANLRFQIKPFEAIKLSTEPNYRIKGILPRTGLVVIWGPPKCGKSFWTFDATMHIALGWKYRGRKVQQGTVVYLALEGGKGFARRVEAWRRRHLANHNGRVPFYLLDVPVDLVADHAALIADIRAQVIGPTPGTIVIDTLNRSLNGSEGKDEDMAKYIRAADAIHTAFGCLVIIVHHCGVAGNRPRGHTSLAGADDAQIAVERSKEGVISATVEHMKDGEDGVIVSSKLERVDLGMDDDGDPITSMVIVPTNIVAVAEPKLTKTQKFALDALKKVIAKGDIANPPAGHDCPASWPVVLSEKWRQQFYDTYPGDKRDTKKKALLRATLDLEEAGFIVLWREYVWLRDIGTERDK